MSVGAARPPAPELPPRQQPGVSSGAPRPPVAALSSPPPPVRQRHHAHAGAVASGVYGSSQAIKDLLGGLFHYVSGEGSMPRAFSRPQP